MLQAFTKRFSVGQGLFISFEGGEGSGKSTQIKLLGESFKQLGYDVILTREPGGCDSALLLRKLLVEGDPERWDGLSEVLLYSAARNEHLRQVIRPGLAAGKIILCDRFADSTVAYQGAGHGIAPEIVDTVTNIVVGDTWPTITLLLDLPTDEGLKRAAIRYEDQHENRFERLGVDFHQRLRDGYLARAKAFPKRFVVVDARGNIPVVQQNILDALNSFADRS